MPAERPLKIGLVQMEMSSDAEDNLDKAVRMSRQAVSLGAEVVCLPELFTTPYFPREEDPGSKRELGGFLNTIPGLVTEALSELARSTGAVVVGGSLYEASGEDLFNTATVFDADGGMLGRYRKTHIPHDECFYEQHYFKPGDTGFKVFQTARGPLSVLICYDQWFPEAARCCALLGAEIIFYPTAIGNVRGVEQTEGDWQQAWENVMRGHAIANALPVCAVNRVGIEGETDFFGGSFVCDAFGRTLARAGNEEEVLLAEVDMEHGRRVRQGWGFFHNRRPECYMELVRKERRCW